MSKIRSCFVTFIILFFIGSLVFLCVLASSSGLFSSKDLLFLGIDEREGGSDFKGRTDTIVILHVNKMGKKDMLISIPRDTRVYLEGHGWNKINAAYVYGGVEMTKSEIFELTGIDVNKYMIINFDGFKDIIDLLGGVEITVSEPLHDPLSGANFDPGTYHMNGEQALSFARCRATARADLDRIDRQQYLLKALISQKLNLSALLKLPEIISVINEKTLSDFSLLDYLTVGLILSLSNKDMDMITIPTKPANIDGISYLIADEKEVKAFLKEHLD
ncbi:MAG: LCP family protein [Actinobacteria bacterium]|nr:LCP family protein [Actinomycetota bacterium]